MDSDGGTTEFDDLLADIQDLDAPPPPPPPPPPAAVPPPAPSEPVVATPPPDSAPDSPPDLGFFSPPPAAVPTAPDPTESPTGESPTGESAPPSRPGRQASATSGPVTRRGKGTGLGGVAVFLGVVSLLMGWFLPGFVYLVAITLAGTLFLGGWTFRHAVNYDTPGKTSGGIAVVLGVLSIIAFVVGLQRERDQATSVTGGGGLLGAMAAMETEMEVRQLTLEGTGTATLTIDGQVVQVPLEACGFDEPALGVALAGRGTADSGGRSLELSFMDTTLGGTKQAAVVSIGSNGYALSGTDIFTVEGDTLTVEGDFRKAFGAGTISVALTARCSG